MAAGFRKRDLHAPDKAVSNSVVPVSGAAVFRANEGQVAVFRGEPVALWGDTAGAAAGVRYRRVGGAHLCTATGALRGRHKIGYFLK